MRKITSKKRPKPPKGGSIDRAFSILEAFVPHEPSLGLAELAERTGLYKSTILRIMTTLVRKGYLVQLSDGNYRLGPTVAGLGRTYQESFRLEDHLMPVLERLADQSGESASFHVREGTNGICLFRVQSQQCIRDNIQVGTLIPLTKGASGEVITAFEHPRTASGALVRMSVGALAPDSAALAVPVFGQGDCLVGALALSGPKARFTRITRLAMSAQLIEAAQQLTLQLGGDSTLLQKSRSPLNIRARLTEERPQKAQRPRSLSLV